MMDSTSTTRQEHQFFKLTVLLVVPLLFVPWLAETRELPRHALVQLVAFASLAWHLWRSQNHRPSAWTAAAVGFGAILVLACVGATSPGRSLFGPYEGHCGALAWGAYLALAWTAPSIRSLPTWSTAGIALGSVQALWALAQQSGGTPPTGSMGHVMFLSGLCMLMIPVALGAYVDQQRLRAQVPLALAVLVMTAALVMTSRRGAMLGLVTAVVVLLVLTPHRKRLLWPLVGMVAVVESFSFIPSAHHGEMLAKRMQDTLAPFAVQGGWDTVSQRMDFYRVAVNQAWESPLLGCGFGCFRDMYAAHKSPMVSRFEIQVHNVWLDVLLSLGVLGVLALVALLLVWAWRAWKTLKENQGSEVHGRLCGIAAMAVAHLVYVNFNFDQPGMAAWSWALAGFLVGWRPAGEGWGVPRWTQRTAALAPLALAPLGLWHGAADAWMAMGARAEAHGESQQAITHFNRAVDMLPHECLYTLRLVASQRAYDAPGTAQARMHHLQRCKEREPSNAFVHYFLGLARRESVMRPDLLVTARALADLAQARDLAPTFGMFRQGLAQTLADVGDPTHALAELDEALRLEPQNAAFHNDRGNVLVMLNEFDKAREAFEQAIRLHPSQATYRQNLLRLEQVRGATRVPQGAAAHRFHEPGWNTVTIAVRCTHASPGNRFRVGRLSAHPACRGGGWI